MCLSGVFVRHRKYGKHIRNFICYFSSINYIKYLCKYILITEGWKTKRVEGRKNGRGEEWNRRAEA